MDGSGIPGPELDGVYCSRCSLYYPSKYAECPRCAEMSDTEAKDYGQRVRSEIVETNRPLAKFFIWATVIILVFMVIFSLPL